MKRAYALLLLIWFIALPVAAQDFPALTGRVVDEADILPPDREAALTAKLAALEAATRHQFVIATIAGLNGRTIEDYGYQLGRHWGIGRSKIDDGLILIVAPFERETRIEVGTGLTPIVTDALAKVIIENDILPKFRDNDLPGGIDAGADRLISILSLPAPQAQARAQRIIEEAKPSLWVVALGILIGGGLLLLFVGYWLYVLWNILGAIFDLIVRMLRGERVITWIAPDARSAYRRSGSSGTSSGSSWSSSSSSSSFSGGGGSFSGGGASGRW